MLTKSRLWHQLTDVLKEFYGSPLSADLRLRVFTQFVSSFQTKINQLSLVSFALASAAQCADSGEALQFVSNIVDKVNSPESVDAYIYAQIELARVKLSLQDLEGAKTLLDEASKSLDSVIANSNIINAAYYAVSSEYFKLKADFTSYYRNSLLYLACIELKDLSQLQQQQRAYDLAVAALLGDKIYNFGELLLHPILESLKNTEYKWLCDLLFALNAGDIKSFEQLSGHLSKQPLLQNSLPFLRQKICLTALTEAVFQRPTSSRILSFDTIAKETHLVHNEVEHLIMKALSLGLLKGFIDQVAETVIITWVQPRVMNLAQIESMRQRLVKWDSEVKNLGDWIQDAGADIWTN
ncbi:proteasome regulatory particle lid subunit RPN9 [Sugiyamaella lignohabitans]|uniref:Proteasome regulatory particle lid subunit RPN9 n=1 Tax=Sugiyamaella lignohabitans TaxID=796027 RepID=A0A161HIC6_9ASCO|nr:proteasome regulatory particle lid subunit RPN9 [Sugiyamaella lignohabitans]ANB12217.1 proteasome regulatory particle lid subunit RPN9 [Sugiyamaella lignohabitans]